MKIARYLWMGFFLLLFLAGAGCASTKGQISGKPETASPKNQAQMQQPPSIQKETGPVNLSAEKETAKANEAPAKVETSSPPAPIPSVPEKRMRAPVTPMPAPAQPALPLQPGQVPGPAPSPTKPAELPRGQKFVLNFDNADLYEVIRVMSQMMKINYIIDPRVKGVVNIHTSGQIGQEELFPIFQAILKLNGATAALRGGIYEIVPFADAKKLAIEPMKSKESGKAIPDEKYSIQIIALKFIPSTEATKILKPFLSDGADIVEYSPQNILVIGDIASNIRKSLEIMELFDLDVFASQYVRIYPVTNADVNEVAKEMERIFASFEVSLKSGRGVGITFTPIVRNNSLLAVSSIPNIFEKVEAWLKELDRVPVEGSKLSVFVYYVQNGKAKDVADVLKQVFVAAKEKKTEFKEKTTQPSSTTPRSTRPTTPSPLAPKEEPGTTTSGVPEGDINIVVDETTNSLIIRAYQRDYNAIVETIKKLDLYPKQALIEVLLAEVTLDESLKYGLEFSQLINTWGSNPQYRSVIGLGGIAQVGDSFTSGLRYAITATDRITAAIHASATDDRLKVITSPHILASNNKEAKIQIGSSEPILTNTYTTPGATAASTTTISTGIVEGTIEYKDIGVILSVTPRISDAKLVTLDISIEQSSVSLTTLGNLGSIPRFPKKTAKTTLSISEGQTIVIGGLIDDSKNVTKAGVPFLSKIPILGALFGYHTYQNTGTETILMLTPHVISDLAESNRITHEFREKVGAIKKELESIEKKQMKIKKKESDKEQPSPSSISP